MPHERYANDFGDEPTCSPPQKWMAKPSELFVRELLPGLFQRLALRFRHLRVPQIQPADGGGQDVGDDGPGDPLVIGRDDVLGGPVGARGAEGVFVRLHVLVPEVALCQV
jgi:hypothetical protein